jgi:hypothetical protein
MRTFIAGWCKWTCGVMQGNWPALVPRLQAVHLGRAGSFSVVCVTHIFKRQTSKGLLFLCWGCFLVNTFPNTLCLGLLLPRAKIKLSEYSTCKTRNFATSILRVRTSENVTICAVGWYICDDLHRTLKGFQISCRKSASNGKIPTLENGAFNCGRSSTLYEYAAPRNVTEF